MITHKHIAHHTIPTHYELGLQRIIHDLSKLQDDDAIEALVETYLRNTFTPPHPIQLSPEHRKNLLTTLLNPTPYYQNESAYTSIVSSTLAALDLLHQNDIDGKITTQSPTPWETIRYLTAVIDHSQLKTKDSLLTIIGNYVSSPLLTDIERRHLLRQIYTLPGNPLRTLQSLLAGYFDRDPSNFIGTPLPPLTHIVGAFIYELIPIVSASPKDNVEQLLQLLKHIPFQQDVEKHFTSQLLAYIKQKPTPKQVRQIAHLILYSFSKKTDDHFPVQLLTECLAYTDSQATTESLKIHIRSHHNELARLPHLQELIDPQKTLKRKR